MADTELEYYTILTNAGVNYEAECIATEAAFHLTHIAIGDGGGDSYEPQSTQTELVNEINRYEVTGEELDTADGLYYAMTEIPATDGEFTIRELGGYNADGELVMVAKFPPMVKRSYETGDLRRTFIRMDLSIVDRDTYPTTIDSSLAFPSTEYVNNKFETILEEDKNNVKITGDQTIDGVKTFVEDIDGNCASATKLKTSRKISLSGAVEGSVSFNGTSAVTIETTIGDTFNPAGLSSLFTAFMPDWDNPTALSSGVTYTAEESGWIQWHCHEDDTERTLKINNYVVACVRAASSHDACGTAALLPVTVGDTYYCNKKSDFNFFPLRGANSEE